MGSHLLNARLLLTRVFSWVVLAPFFLLITGCGLQPQVTEQRIYVLQAQTTPARATSLSNKVLMIAQARAEAGFDTRRIAYTDTPSALSYYGQSEWADLPAKLITPLIVEAIEKTAAFRAVLMQPTPIAADQRLDIELLRLQQDFLQQPSQAHLTLRASLSDAASNILIANRLFDVREPAPSEDAYGGVQAANAALSKALTELADWVLEQER